MGGWLMTVVGRVCLDMLRSRRSRREEYVGSWLPEPIVSLDSETAPQQQALIADSLGLALLVVLEQLTPPERLAFVLHGMIAVTFEEIAPIVGRSPEAARQLASRARRRVQGAAPAPDLDVARHREIVDAFLAASEPGTSTRCSRCSIRTSSSAWTRGSARSHDRRSAARPPSHDSCSRVALASRLRRGRHSSTAPPV